MENRITINVKDAVTCGRVLLAVPESDCHVVACKLLELYLEHLNYEVHNLGVTTPSAEIAAAAERIQPLAIFLSSQNGHALMDLQTLDEELRRRGVTAPVYLGGNLTLGCEDSPEIVRQKFENIGIEVLSSFEDAALKLSVLSEGEMSRFFLPVVKPGSASERGAL
jgi:methylaspartate mutase S subunit